jgi:hypothetical protein
MWHLGLSEAPNTPAEALITGREMMFVSHSGPDHPFGEDAAVASFTKVT